MRNRGFLLTLLLLGCGNATLREPPLDREGYDLAVCDPSSDFFRDISPTRPVDYLELSGDGSAQTRGTRCGGATDVDACELALSRLVPPSGWALRPDGGAPSPRVHLTFTRGDEVGAIGTTELAAFLSPADTLADAAFLAQVVTRGRVDCDAPAGRITPEGIEVITLTEYPCGGAIEEHRVLVAPSGDATVLETALLRPGTEEICP
jgi:hypothetical protein